MLDKLFNIERYMPHGYCFLWQQELVWMHVVSDLAIAIAYFSIPVTLVYLLFRKGKFFPYRWVFRMFAIFIFWCGMTHLVQILTLWYPYYYLQGIVKIITAAVSVATAVMLFPLIPELVGKFSQLEKINQTMTKT